MKKKNLHLKRALLILLVCLMGMAKAMGQSFTVGDLNYSVNYDGATVTVTGHVDGTAATGSLVIPESVTYEGTMYAVTEIGNSAFRGCNGFTGDLNIPNSVTSIGNYAFKSCDGFTGNLNISNSVTSIGNNAFDRCYSFTGNLNIPNSVTYIGSSAFRFCDGFTGDLNIPNSVIFIGTNPFVECPGLEHIEVAPENPVYDSRNNCNAIIETNTNELISGCMNSTIPNSVTSIGNDAFVGCSGLSNLIIPISVTSIGLNNPFYDCSGLEHIEVALGNPVYDSRNNCNAIIETNTNELISGCMNSTIPNSVTSIGGYAFYGCNGLTGELIIPNSVTTIGNGAFVNCTSLTGNLSIPNSVISISNQTFYGCNGLTTLTLGNSVATIGNQAFELCTGLTTITIPVSVTSIGMNPFYGCSGLEHIEVVSGNPVYDSRNNCNAIIETNTNELISGCMNSSIPNSVTSIGDWAFYDCSGLTGELIIPNSVTSIGNGAFCNCSGFTTINIPNSVTSIDNYAFYNCTGLISMTVLADNPPTTLGNSVFYNVPKDIPVYVPSGTIGAYQNADGWNEFTNYIEMEAPVLPADYVSDGLIMYLDGINNTRNGHSTTTDVWEDLMGNYDLAVTNYSSYTWEDHHFIGLGDGGYLNTGYTWQYFNSLNDDITFEIVAYIDCDKTSPGYRGLVGWHSGNDGTNCQNDQGYNRMQTLGELPVSDADDQIATVSYTRFNGSFLNGVWKTNANTIPSGINSNQTVVFGNSFAQCRGWNDSIYCIRMYNRTLTPEEVAYNHSIDIERFGAGNGGSTPIDDFVFHTYVDDSVFAMNTPIPIHGTVMDNQNAPVVNVEVEISIFVMGMRRSLQATTDENGVFSATFEPMPSESGYYTVNSGRVGNNSTEVHDDFNIPGMAIVTEGYVLCPVTQNQPRTDTLRLRNKSNLPLSDIQVSVISAPEGCSISFMPLSLNGMETDDLIFTVNGTELTQGNQYQEIKLRATSNEGAETDFSIWYYCMEPRGILEVTPKNITSTMTKGQSKIIDVMLSNNGTAATGNIFIDLPNVEWMSVVGSDTLPSLAVNDSAFFSLRLSPGNDIPLVQYSGNIAINC